MGSAAGSNAGSAASADLLTALVGGDRRAIARAMAIAESTTPGSRDLVAEIHRRAGRAHVIGITGVPGAGKSTMVRALAQQLRARGKTVGIVAIDPSSPFSGGAILGDRIRMSELSGDRGVFIRSMATRGALGGLARATLDVADVLDAAGFDCVLIETVGVGQDEVDVVQAAHTVAVVSAPGLGDEVQAIKAGVLEIADVHVVSKCDRPDSGKTVIDLRTMLKLGGLGRGDTSWTVPVIPTSAQNRDGIEALVDAIEAHGEHLHESGEIVSRRRTILETRILKASEDIIRSQLLGRHRATLNRLIEEVGEGVVDPYRAALTLIGTVGDGTSARD